MKKHHNIHIGGQTSMLKKIGKNPFVDWFLILSISFVLSLVFVWYGISLFLSTNAADASPLAQTTPTASGTLNKADLARLIANFQDKKNRTALFQSGYTGPTDPSATTTRR